MPLEEKQKAATLGLLADLQRGSETNHREASCVSVTLDQRKETTAKQKKQPNSFTRNVFRKGGKRQAAAFPLRDATLRNAKKVRTFPPRVESRLRGRHFTPALSVQGEGCRFNSTPFQDSWESWVDSGLQRALSAPAFFRQGEFFLFALRPPAALEASAAFVPRNIFGCDLALHKRPLIA